MTERRRPSESSTSTGSFEQDDRRGTDAVMEEKQCSLAAEWKLGHTWGLITHMLVEREHGDGRYVSNLEEICLCRLESRLRQLNETIGLALMGLDKEKLRREAERDKKQRQRHEQEVRWHSRILEAAFDGDLPEIVAVLKELSDRETSDHIEQDDVGLLIRQRHQRELVNCTDANGNTPLSEAAAGGHVDTVRYLLHKGGDVNTIGLFKRTPLYRAAFCGHLQICQILLSNGADPRIYAEDGQTPEMVTTVPTIKSLLHNWDLSLTDEMLDTIGQSESMYDDRQERLKLNEAERLRQQYHRTQREWDRLSQDVVDAKEKLAKKRESERDGPTNSTRFDKLLEEVRVAEQREEECRLKLDQLRHKFSALHLQAPVDIEDDSRPGLRVLLRDLDEVLIMDSEEKIVSSGKWPLVIDTTDQTSIFLRYCDTNYLDAYQPRNMEPQTIRLAILGGIRYGKPVVVDLHGTDMFDAVCMKFDKVIPGLMDLLLSKRILHNDRYMALVKESDGPDYHKSQFTTERILHFKLIFLTQMVTPPEALVKRTFLIRVMGSSGRSRRSLVIEALEQIFLDIISAVSLNEIPAVHVPNRRDWENTTFCLLNGVEMKSTVKSTTCIAMRKPPAAHEFAVFVDIMSKIFVLLQTATKSTKREIYYKNVNLYGSQTAVDYVIDSLAALLRVPRFWLNVVASSKGFVSGSLQFVDAQGHSIDCSAKAGGTLIPSNVADITDLRTKARWALIVEKDATFQTLLDAGFPQRFGPCLLITGKGFPDINTRHFVKCLWQLLNIPLFALVDADPHGIEIMCVYRFGSLAQSHDSANLTCAAIRWIGILPTEIKSLAVAQSAITPLSNVDVRKSRSLLQRPYIRQNPQLQQEVSAMLSSGTKVEIECLSTDFLCQTYLPDKIRNGRWL